MIVSPVIPILNVVHLLDLIILEGLVEVLLEKSAQLPVVLMQLRLLLYPLLLNSLFLLAHAL